MFSIFHAYHQFRLVPKKTKLFTGKNPPRKKEITRLLTVEQGHLGSSNFITFERLLLVSSCTTLTLLHLFVLVPFGLY